MRVITRDSVYEVEGGFLRRLGMGGRHEQRRDGEWLRVVQMEPPTVGETWLTVLACDRDSCRDDETEWVTYRRTTTVLAIKE